MTKDELIALAKEAGMRHDSAGFVTDFNLHSVEFETLERFAELVAAKEREECAKVCESYPSTKVDQYDCAEAIRARKP